jgi:hypothetical protein
MATHNRGDAMPLSEVKLHNNWRLKYRFGSKEKVLALVFWFSVNWSFSQFVANDCERQKAHAKET